MPSMTYCAMHDEMAFTQVCSLTSTLFLSPLIFCTITNNVLTIGIRTLEYVHPGAVFWLYVLEHACSLSIISQLYTLNSETRDSLWGSLWGGSETSSHWKQDIGRQKGNTVYNAHHILFLHEVFSNFLNSFSLFDPFYLDQIFLDPQNLL